MNELRKLGCGQESEESEEFKAWVGCFTKELGTKKGTNPDAPIPSASGFGVGFGCLNTFSKGIWSSREKYHEGTGGMARPQNLGRKTQMFCDSL